MSGWPKKKQRTKDKNVVYLDTYYKEYKGEEGHLRSEKNLTILARIKHHGDCMGMIPEWGDWGAVSGLDGGGDISIY